jgi:predicted phage tail protein
VLAYPAKASATLTWVAPEQNGGTAITGYNVYKGTASGGESATPVNKAPLAATLRGYTATGLSNNKKYYFTIEAIDATGKSAASNEASTTPTTAHTAPGAPKTLAAVAAAGSAGLTWVAPASTGGSAITGYNVYVGSLSSGESATPVNSTPLASTAHGYTVTGLSNASRYYFTVEAINAVGLGAPSNEAAATPEAAATFPGAPRNVSAATGVLQVTLTWAAPLWNGGSALTGYNVYVGTVSGGESSTPVNPTPLSPTSTGHIVTSLSNGTKYYFIVKAINAIGVGAASSEVSAIPS